MQFIVPNAIHKLSLLHLNLPSSWKTANGVSENPAFQRSIELAEQFNLEPVSHENSRFSVSNPEFVTDFWRPSVGVDLNL
jgi:hypothetical protein